jgi:hypothetical protein
MDISRPASPASLLDVSAGYCQRTLAGESAKTGTQMGIHNRLIVVSVYGASMRYDRVNSKSNV